MDTTIKKTTKVVTAVSWEATLTDEGRSIAKMTGSLNANSPLGNTNLIVLNSAKYAEHADDIKDAYASFQAMVQTAVSEMGDLSASTTETLE